MNLYHIDIRVRVNVSQSVEHEPWEHNSDCAPNPGYCGSLYAAPSTTSGIALNLVVTLRPLRRTGPSPVSPVSSLTFRPAGLFVENLSFFAYHALETQFPEVGEEVEGSIECLGMGPAVPFHKTVNTIKKVLNLIPALCVYCVAS